MYINNVCLIASDNQLVEITLRDPEQQRLLLTFGIYSQDFSGSDRIIGSLAGAIGTAAATILFGLSEYIF